MPGRRPQRSVRCLPVLKENCFFAVNGLCDDVSCWETDPTVHLEGAAFRKRRISFQVSLLHVLMELGEVAEYTHEGREGAHALLRKGTVICCSCKGRIRTVEFRQSFQNAVVWMI